MNVKAYQIHSHENGWRGFIYDKDSCSDVVTKFFPNGALTAEREDRETVKEARDVSKTVITSNEKDFIRFTLEVQNRSIFPRCEDCWGWVIILNANLQRRRAFAKARIRSGLQIGGERLTWKAAMWANLCLKITSDGKMIVRKFEPCEHCQRDLPIQPSEVWLQSNESRKAVVTPGIGICPGIFRLTPKAPNTIPVKARR